MSKKLKIGIISGEASGDQLGAELIKHLKDIYGYVEIVGVGGDKLEAQGLKSFFPMSDISLMGITQVLCSLPKLFSHISNLSNYFLAQKIDALIIIDSPDFTHRVAKRIKKADSTIPIIQYVAPSVWAWREDRAYKMAGYVDHVLLVLPFEESYMKKLGGPKSTYVGHQLVQDVNIDKIFKERVKKDKKENKSLLLLPGSRRSEISRLLPEFLVAANSLCKKIEDLDISIITLPHLKQLIFDIISRSGSQNINVIDNEAEKIQKFIGADAALAASGTVSLELALCNIPMILAYKLDFIANIFIKPRVKIWSAALPNIIAQKPIITELYNEFAKADVLVKHIEYIFFNDNIRQAQYDGFSEVREIMKIEKKPGYKAAETVFEIIKEKKASIN